MDVYVWYENVAQRKLKIKKKKEFLAVPRSELFIECVSGGDDP